MWPHRLPLLSLANQLARSLFAVFVIDWRTIYQLQQSVEWTQRSELSSNVNDDWLCICFVQDFSSPSCQVSQSSSSAVAEVWNALNEDIDANSLIFPNLLLRYEDLECKQPMRHETLYWLIMEVKLNPVWWNSTVLNSSGLLVPAGYFQTLRENSFYWLQRRKPERVTDRTLFVQFTAYKSKKAIPWLRSANVDYPEKSLRPRPRPMRSKPHWRSTA